MKSSTKRALLYVLAALIIAGVVWVVLWGTNVFNYIDRANEIRQEQQDGQ